MKRIINKDTRIFIRDDWDASNSEIALDVNPASGFYLPKWDGTKWVEGKTTAEIAPILAAEALAVTVERNRLDINTYLKQAILDNKTFLALPTPTVAERNAQINKAARQLIRIERLLLNQLDSVE